MGKVNFTHVINFVYSLNIIKKYCLSIGLFILNGLKNSAVRKHS